jgi:hypothetical protein
LTAAAGKLWAVGGAGNAGVKVEYYDPATNAWTTTTPDLGSVTAGGVVQRSLHAAGTMNGLLYIVGGMPSSGTPQQSVYVLDPLNPAGGWTQAPNMPTARIAFGGSVGILVSGTPPTTIFIAAGGSTTTSGTPTNTVDRGGGG